MLLTLEARDRYSDDRKRYGAAREPLRTCVPPQNTIIERRTLRHSHASQFTLHRVILRRRGVYTQERNIRYSSQTKFANSYRIKYPSQIGPVSFKITLPHNKTQQHTGKFVKFETASSLIELVQLEREAGMEGGERKRCCKLEGEGQRRHGEEPGEKGREGRNLLERKSFNDDFMADFYDTNYDNFMA